MSYRYHGTLDFGYCDMVQVLPSPGFKGWITVK